MRAQLDKSCSQQGLWRCLVKDCLWAENYKGRELGKQDVVKSYKCAA